MKDVPRFESGRWSFICFVIAIAIAVSSCGGGGGSSEDASTNEDLVSVSGRASAPAGSIAQIGHKFNMLAAFEFVFPSALAGVTGLSAISGAAVELIRIDSDGNQVGNVLAKTRTNNSGGYSLDLPARVSPSADLIIQIKNSSGQSVLRAIVSSTSVNIDPVSEFIVDALIVEPGLILENLDINGVQNLVEQLSSIDIPLSGQTIPEAIDEIKNLPSVTSGVSRFINRSFIAGAWTDGSNTPQMLILFSDGRFLHWRDCTATGDGVGVEYGLYTYDGSIMTSTPLQDENGGCGISEWQLIPVSVDSRTLNFGGSNSGMLSRAWNGNPSSIEGGWDTRSSADDPAGIVFFQNGNYIHFQNERKCSVNGTTGGVEYGTYNFDGATIRGVALRDDNFDCGLANGTGQFSYSTVSVSGTITFDNGDPVEFERIETITKDAPKIGKIVSITMTPDNFVTIDGGVFRQGYIGFFPDLRGNNQLELNYKDGSTQPIDCPFHHYNYDLRENILHCVDKDNNYYVALHTSNPGVISFNEGLWSPGSPGKTQITGRLLFEHESAEPVRWIVSLESSLEIFIDGDPDHACNLYPAPTNNAWAGAPVYLRNNSKDYALWADIKIVGRSSTPPYLVESTRRYAAQREQKRFLGCSRTGNAPSNVQDWEFTIEFSG